MSKDIVTPCKTNIQMKSGVRSFWVFCTIEIQWQEDNKVRISISGVEGPFSNGNCAGGCGQIDMHIREDPCYVAEYGPGWDEALFREFLDVWDYWHLNNMRTGCQHQRAMNWGNEYVQVATLNLRTDIWRKRQKIKERAEQNLRNGVLDMTTAFDSYDLMIYSLPSEMKAPGEDIARYMQERDLDEFYVVANSERKYAGHVYETEHPRGVLTKPCPECGYKYGSAWLYEHPTQEVIDFLSSLPPAAVELPTKWRD